MTMETYRVIQQYHARLGELPDGATDYIGKYRIFGLDICIENETSVTVE